MAERGPGLRLLARGVAFAASLVAAGWAAHWLVGTGALSERWIDMEVAGHGGSGFLVFAAVGTLATALGFPRQVVAFLGGYAFGAMIGAELAMLATVLGCIATFGYARLFGRPIVAQRFPGRVARLDEFLNAAPFTMTLVIRLLPVGSNVVTNLIAGVTRVRFASFIGGSAVGYVPQTLAFALAGAGMLTAPFSHAIVAGSLLAASGFVGVRLFRRHRRGAALERSIDAVLKTGHPSGKHAL